MSLRRKTILALFQKKLSAFNVDKIATDDARPDEERAAEDLFNAVQEWDPDSRAASQKILGDSDPFDMDSDGRKMEVTLNDFLREEFRRMDLDQSAVIDEIAQKSEEDNLFIIDVYELYDRIQEMSRNEAELWATECDLRDERSRFVAQSKGLRKAEKRLADKFYEAKKHRLEFQATLDQQLRLLRQDFGAPGMPGAAPRAASPLTTTRENAPHVKQGPTCEPSRQPNPAERWGASDPSENAPKGVRVPFGTSPAERLDPSNKILNPAWFDSAIAHIGQSTGYTPETQKQPWPQFKQRDRRG